MLGSRVVGLGFIGSRNIRNYKGWGNCVVGLGSGSKSLGLPGICTAEKPAPSHL